jgi:hypothetical protein
MRIDKYRQSGYPNASRHRQGGIFLKHRWNKPKLFEGLGYFLHVKMPGYRLASLSAATTLHFTACCIQLLLSQNPTAFIAYLGGSSQLLIRSTGAIILSCSQRPHRAQHGMAVFLRIRWRKTKAHQCFRRCTCNRV